MNDLAARIEHYRVQDDRLREKPRHSSKRLYGDDLNWFRLNVTGYLNPLPPPSSGECWIWNGQTSASGAPQIRVAGKLIGAVQAAYATWIRPVPEGARIRHACGKTLCVNPAHLTARGDEADDDWMNDHSHASPAKRRYDSAV